MHRIELDLRKRIIKIFKTVAGVHAMPVENPAHTGTPDINLCNVVTGDYWVEVKIVEEYPKRPATPLKIDHFTVAQKTWMKDRKSAGGSVFILAQVEEDYYLFTTNPEVIEHLGSTWNKADWNSNCDIVSKDLMTILERFI